MASGGLIAAAAAVVGGLGYVLYKRAKAAPASSGGSTCKTLCVTAAKAGDVTGGLSTTTPAGIAQIEQVCSKTCGLVDNLGPGATAIGQGTSAVVGWLNGWGDRQTVDLSNNGGCPAGSHLETMYRPLNDARIDTKGNVGKVCRDDKTNAIIGTLDSAGFHPGAWTVPTAPLPTTKIPVPTLPSEQPTSTSSSWLTKVVSTAPTQPSGGTTVTTSTTSTRNTMTPIQQAAYDAAKRAGYL